MNKVFGSFALIVFVASAFVHALTFFPTLAITSKAVYSLHVLAMISFFPMVLSMQRFKKEYPDMFSARNFWPSLKLFLSVPLRFLCQAAIVYAFINFILCFVSFEGGTPREVSPGKWELQHKGRIIRKISETEAQGHEARLVRGFSGHWIVFSLLPVVFFLTAVPAIEAQKKIEHRA